MALRNKNPVAVVSQQQQRLRSTSLILISVRSAKVGDFVNEHLHESRMADLKNDVQNEDIETDPLLLLDIENIIEILYDFVEVHYEVDTPAFRTIHLRIETLSRLLE